MAKEKAAARKKLMPAGEVKVKSRAYGEHTRATRGSKTPVGLNEAFALHNARTVAINGIAKRVHDLLKICGEHFKEKMLWQVMLGRMRKATSDDMMGLLMALKGMELNSRYPLERFAGPKVRDVKWDKKGCEMVMSKGQPCRNSDDTEYCYEVLLLMLGKDAGGDGLMRARSEWMNGRARKGKYRLRLRCRRRLCIMWCVCIS